MNTSHACERYRQGRDKQTYTQIYAHSMKNLIYEAYPESKDTKVLNMYNTLNLQKRHCE
jgi:hypothetical protein